MAKASPDQILDAALNEIATSTRIVVCSGEPANFAGISAVTLATHVMTAGTAGADYAIANGDTSGRKLTVSQQADISITATGTATHVVLDDGTDLQYVTTCTSQALTSGGTVTVPQWSVEIADPV